MTIYDTTYLFMHLFIHFVGDDAKWSLLSNLINLTTC